MKILKRKRISQDALQEKASPTIYGYKRVDGFQKILPFPVFSINNDYTDKSFPYGYIHISDEYSMAKINIDEIRMFPSSYINELRCERF